MTNGLIDTAVRLQNGSDLKHGEFRRPARSREKPVRGQNIVHAGIHNRELVLQHVRANQPISRVALAELTGLTQATAFKIAQDLLKDNYLLASLKREGLRGQPTSLLNINPDAAYSLGVNIDRDHISIVLLDFGGHVRETFRREIPFPSPTAVTQLFLKSVKWIEQNRPGVMDKVAGIGLSIPDEFARPGNAHLKRLWDEVCLEKLFVAISPLPLVVENDAAAAAIGEMIFGAGKAVNSFFYIYISVGLGGGLVVNRRYVRGSRGLSGELRFLPRVNPFRPSSSALVQGIESIVSIAGLLNALANAGHPLSRIDDATLDDAKAQTVVRDWAGHAADILYLPLLAAICVVDPDAVFIGGNLPAFLIDLLATQTSKRLSISLGPDRSEQIVRPGKIPGNAAAIGAAVLGFKDLWGRNVFE